MNRTVFGLLLVASAILLARPHSAGAGPTHWANFGAAPFPVGTYQTVPLSPGSTVQVLVETGGTRGAAGTATDTLGRASTGLDYSVLRLLAIYNGGGFSTVTTRLTFRNFQVGPSHQRGLFLIGAVNGNSSPIQLATTTPGGTAGWHVVGQPFDFDLFNAFPISWDANTGRFETTTPIGVDSRCIVIDLGGLGTLDSLRVTLQQYLNDGIVFGFGEELGPSVSAPEPTPGAVALAPPSPNPARTSTTLKFAMPARGRVCLSVHDVAGRRIATLANGEFPAGDHAVTWDLRDAHGRRVPPGLVFVRLVTPSGASVRRVFAQG